MSNVTISVMAEASSTNPNIIHVHTKLKYANQPALLGLIDIHSQIPIPGSQANPALVDDQPEVDDQPDHEGEDHEGESEQHEDGHVDNKKTFYNANTCLGISRAGMLDRAECIAIWHLLERTPAALNVPHDKITIEVSSGALRRMTQRDHLKVFDQGAVNNTQMAKYTRFLCTKYFGVKVNTLRTDKFWKNIDRNALSYHVTVEWTVPQVYHSGKWGFLYVSVHSMNRAVLRTQLPQPQSEQALLDQPNSLWTTTYQYLGDVWRRAQSLILPRDVFDNLTAKEGVRPNARLRFYLDPLTKTVYVTSKVGSSYTLITVLPTDKYNGKIGKAIHEGRYTAAKMNPTLQHQIDEQIQYHTTCGIITTHIPFPQTPQ